VGLQVWYREDIENNLCAIHTAMRSTVTVLEDTTLSLVYCQGFEAALKSVARAFGVTMLPQGMLSMSEGAVVMPPILRIGSPSELTS